MNIKPLLATKAEYDKIRYPVLATPKLDGIRCLMIDGVAMSRSLKPIPNLYVQEELKGLHGLDGELMLKGDFNDVQSGIMSVEGEPDFTYHVFDAICPEVPYHERINGIRINELDWHPRVELLEPEELYYEEELDEFLESCLSKGYEGAMIRDPNGRYKFGRSTAREGILLKIKRFLDDEAVLYSFIEKMHNTNEAKRDALGKIERSSAKEGLVPADTAGAIVVEWNGLKFKVGFGPGITDHHKQRWWDERQELIGKKVTFRYQELSKDGIPRFGKMIGFRHEDDL